MNADAAEMIATFRAAIAKYEASTALPGRPTQAAKPAAPESATDAELDAKYGDPEVRRDPPRWDGSSFVGRRFSQTTPQYLDATASFKDWSAAKNEEQADPERAKFIKFDRRDAQLARGWARRLRAKGTTPVATPTTEERGFDADDDIPF